MSAGFEILKRPARPMYDIWTTLRLSSQSLQVFSGLVCRVVLKCYIVWSSIPHPQLPNYFVMNFGQWIRLMGWATGQPNWCPWVKKPTHSLPHWAAGPVHGSWAMWWLLMVHGIVTIWNSSGQGNNQAHITSLKANLYNQPQSKSIYILKRSI